MTILGLILYFNDFCSCCSHVYILEHSFTQLKACCTHAAVAREPSVVDSVRSLDSAAQANAEWVSGLTAQGLGKPIIFPLFLWLIKFAFCELLKSQAGRGLCSLLMWTSVGRCSHSWDILCSFSISGTSLGFPQRCVSVMTFLSWAAVTKKGATGSVQTSME